MSKSIDEIMKEFNEKMAKKESCCGKCDTLTANGINAVNGNGFYESGMPLFLLMSMLPNTNADGYNKGKADAYKEMIDKLLHNGKSE